MKKRIYLILTILILAFFAETFLGVTNKWPYSLVELKATKAETEQEIINYENNLMSRLLKKNELRITQEELDFLKEKAPDLREYEAEFHYPSLLIFLEKEAVDRELALTIHHDQIRSDSYMVDGDDEEKRPPQQGVEVTTVPISLEGEYESIRDFITFIEKKDYMAINSYKLITGENIKADIDITVFSIIVD